MCSNTLSSHPLSRCGSVILEFMMKFNQSVIVSDVLTSLSDAARQDKFGVFKVDPGSIKEVLIRTDGLESSTQGKYYKAGWLVFPKVFKGVILFENDGLFYLYSESNFLSNHFFEKEAKYGPTLIGHLQVVVGFCKFHRQRTPKFFPVPSQLEFTFSMVTGLNCIIRAVFRPGLVYYCLNLYKMYPLIHLGPEECHCPCNDVLLKGIIGVLAFIILLLIAYIIWLHRRGK